MPSIPHQPLYSTPNPLEPIETPPEKKGQGFIVMALGVLALAWGGSYWITHTHPIVPPAVTVDAFHTTQGVTPDQQAHINRVVSDWLTRDPSLADDPVRLRTLLRTYIGD